MFEGKNFIDNEFDNSEKDQFFNAENPSTEEIYGTFPQSTANDIGRAVSSARKAFSKWKLESRVRRAEYFDKLASLIQANHDLLKQAISIETGKNLNESHAEVNEALHMCQVVAAMGRQSIGECFASELASKDSWVVRKPRGVVAVISPWNFPLAIGSFWCAAPAIVEGNTVVHKPSELTPMVNQIVAQLYQLAGFPNGVFNLIHGDGYVGEQLVHSDVDVILFTGSAEVAQKIKLHCASTNLKTCSVEAGSKSATMVFEDGNLDLAVDVSIASAFKLSGQRCVSSGRILVQRSIFYKFVENFCDYVDTKVITCNPFEIPYGTPENYLTYGPLISKRHCDQVSEWNRFVESTNEATVYYGKNQKNHVGDSKKGHFLQPFVYKCEWGNYPFLKNEVFGPHVALIPFDNIEDAIRIYNDTDYGLSLGAVTDDFRKHRQLAQECTTGMLYINGGSIAAESHLPFSSWKKSGFGSSAAGTWKAVTHTMSVTVNYEKNKCQFAQGMK